MTQLSKITYISNAGVLIESGDNKILVDGLCDSKIPMYKNTPRKLREQIIAGIPPFDDINFLLFTHDHGDHFDPVSIARFLKQYNNAVMLANQISIWEVRKLLKNFKYDKWIDSSSPFGREKSILMNGIDIESIPMVHDGEEFRNVQNMAYLTWKENWKRKSMGYILYVMLSDSMK
jgi:mRNA degradation ribonuclease J1/J2